MKKERIGKRGRGKERQRERRVKEGVRKVGGENGSDRERGREGEWGSKGLGKVWRGMAGVGQRETGEVGIGI